MTLTEWEEKYIPIQDSEGCEIFFETYGEHLNELHVAANELALKALPTIIEPYQFIWTRVDSSEGDLILINGFRRVNRIDYCLTTVPWGDGTNNDADTYIEIDYEG